MFAIALGVFLTGQEAIPSVDLVCRGRGELFRMVKPEHKDKSKAPPLWRRESEPFRGAVRFRIRPQGGTAELPFGMVAPGMDRSVDLIKLKASPERIEGKLEISPLYGPVFRIDRISGEVSVEGSQGNFRGECEPFEPETQPRF